MGLHSGAGDVLLVNGRIYPGPPWNEPTNSLAIENGLVSAHGANALQRHSQFASHQIIDCQHRVVLPGFIDSHVHLTSLAESLDQLAFPESTPASDIRELLSKEVNTRAPGDWIIGGKWSRHTLGGLPDATLLDPVSPQHPVALHSKDLHTVLLNSRALAMLDIGRGTPDPAGGEILRDDSEDPTGMLIENAVTLFEERRPRPDFDLFREQHRGVVKHCWRHGITGVHAVEQMRDWEYYRALHEQHALGLRIGGLLPVEESEAIVSRGYRSGRGDDALWVIGIKMFTDGALGSCTAWMKEPYEGTGEYGVPLMSRQQLAGDVSRAHNQGLSVAIHAIGDAAVGMTVDVLREHSSRRSAGLRDRIEHFQLVDPEDLRNIPDGLVGAVQPCHLPGDRGPAEKVWGDRSRYTYAFNSLADHGVVLSFGTDAPVEGIDPWLGIQAAVDRRTSGEEDSWYPAERVSLEESLTAYTHNNGLTGYRPGRMGSLAVGACGDAVVLAQDPWEISSLELKTVKPVCTILNGNVVFSD